MRQHENAGARVGRGTSDGGGLEREGRHRGALAGRRGVLCAGAALLLDPCLWIGADGRAETGFAPFYPPVLRPEEVPAGTAVLYTHSDEDHLGRRTAQALAGAAFYGPAPCARALSEISREAVRVIRPGEKFAVGCIEIEAIPADHGWQSMDVKKYGAPFGPEDCVGYILRTPHAKLLFPGDTRLMPQLRALHPMPSARR